MSHHDRTRAASRDAAERALKAQIASPVNARAYCAYGYRVSDGITVLGFNGELLDTSTCGYALGLGYRLYHPTLRRFGSTDALSPFAEGGLNAYAYCEGDPVNRRDPSGHAFSWSGFLKAVGLRNKTGQFRRHEARQAHVKIQQLEQQVEQLKAANQQFKVANQQLKAANQGLKEDLYQVQLMTRFNNELMKEYKNEWTQLVQVGAYGFADALIKSEGARFFAQALVRTVRQDISFVRSTLV